MDIGAKIQEARILRKMSQHKLSLSTGISQANISKYENNEMEIGIGLLYKIAQATELKISFFLEEENQIGREELEQKAILWIKTLSSEKISALIELFS